MLCPKHRTARAVGQLLLLQCTPDTHAMAHTITATTTTLTHLQCDQTLQPKALAVVISHTFQRSEAEGGGTVPKTWVFCPDPLCMDSKPEGSQLPPWYALFSCCRLHFVPLVVCVLCHRALFKVNSLDAIVTGQLLMISHAKL